MSGEFILPPLQVHPVSIVQFEEQPSPFLLFPSSHSACPIFFPSPQTSTQLDIS